MELNMHKTTNSTPNVEFLQPYPAVAVAQLGIGTVTKPVARYFID
jgi:hypothetical protein